MHQGAATLPRLALVSKARGPVHGIAPDIISKHARCVPDMTGVFPVTSGTAEYIFFELEPLGT